MAELPTLQVPGDATDRMTPFVRPLAQAVEDAALALLGLARGEGVWCTPQRAAPWRLDIGVQGPGDVPLILGLTAAASTERSWAKGGRFALGYRKLEDGSSPFDVPEIRSWLEAMKTSFLEVDEEGGADPRTEALSASLDAYLPFLETDDWMFRQVSSPFGFAVGMIRLGFRCNQDCSFCWQARDWPEPPHHYYETWVREMAGLGVRRLAVSGGEPTLHPELEGIVRVATSELDLDTSLQTNAIRFGRPKYLAAMQAAGLDEIFVSFHSHDATISDAMTRAPGTFQPTIAGVRACLAAGVKVRVNCVVERQNHHQLEDHARFIVDEFVTPYPDNPVREITYSFPSAYFDPEEWRRALVPLDQIGPHLVAAVRRLMASGVRVQALGTCGFPPCVMADAPEALHCFSVETVDTQDSAGRHYGEKCGTCSAQSSCLGVRREYLKLYGDAALRPFETLPDTLEDDRGIEDTSWEGRGPGSDETRWPGWGLGSRRPSKRSGPK